MLDGTVDGASGINRKAPRADHRREGERPDEEGTTDVSEGTPAPTGTALPLRLAVAGAAALFGVLVTGALVMSRTQAAFTASTGNPVNAWQAGTVTLGDDDSGGALFSSAGLLPGDTGSRCITVTYTGDVTAAVKLYASSSTGTLGQYVNLVVEEGSGAGNAGSYAGGCTGFSGSTLYSGTLSAFAAASTGWATGVGTFTPSASGATKVYKFTWTLDAGAPSAAQGTSVTTTFQWESRA